MAALDYSHEKFLPASAQLTVTESNLQGRLKAAWQDRLEAVLPDTFDFDRWWRSALPVFNWYSPDKVVVEGGIDRIEALVKGIEIRQKLRVAINNGASRDGIVRITQRGESYDIQCSHSHVVTILATRLGFGQINREELEAAGLDLESGASLTVPTKSCDRNDAEVDFEVGWTFVIERVTNSEAGCVELTIVPDISAII